MFVHLWNVDKSAAKIHMNEEAQRCASMKYFLKIYKKLKFLFKNNHICQDETW